MFDTCLTEKVRHKTEREAKKKADANTKKQVRAAIPAASRHYAKELMEEANSDREAHGKKTFNDDDEPPMPPKKQKDNTSRKKLARRKKDKTRMVTKSVTDPDCGLFVNGSHKRQFAYEAHTACDSHGFVLETVVTPGNVHDSVAFDAVYNRVSEAFPRRKTLLQIPLTRRPISASRYLMTAECSPQPTSARRR